MIIDFLLLNQEYLHMHFRINRECAEDMTIGGVTFPKGAAIQVPIYQLHRDPRFFPEPELFNPDRYVRGISLCLRQSVR